MSWQRARQQYVELQSLVKINQFKITLGYISLIRSINIVPWNEFVCVISGSATGSGAFNLSQQPPTGATPPSHQPVMGLAQAQANNSNNKTGTYTGTSMSANENNLPEDLQRLMDDWSQEVLIVTHRPRTNSLSISGQHLWGQAVPKPCGQQASDSHVSFKSLIVCTNLCSSKKKS